MIRTLRALLALAPVSRWRLAGASILGALTVFLMVVVMTLPVRTVPPRIHFAQSQKRA